MDNFLERAGAISETVLAVVGLISLVWVIMKRLYKMARNVERIVELTESNTLRIEAMDKELKTNGGTSVKDAVNRIEAKQHEVFDRLERLEARH